ncbi:hypothetical protein D3OALGA1CA_5481 [Olavius algarvensis associated proteobacterium Delta 3]|nr:hypothetical protein D3OALGA1CA_5481 [Olavius algarvensis associated proteobacterium Delta 3]
MIQNEQVMAAIVNPFESTCYDWSGNIIPWDFKNRMQNFCLMIQSLIPDLLITKMVP